MYQVDLMMSMFLYKFNLLHSLDCLCLAWYVESMECFITDILTCDLDHDKCSFIDKFLLNMGLDSIKLTLLPGPQTPQNDIAICSWGKSNDQHSF